MQMITCVRSQAPNAAVFVGSLLVFAASLHGPSDFNLSFTFRKNVSTTPRQMFNSTAVQQITWTSSNTGAATEFNLGGFRVHPQYATP